MEGSVNSFQTTAITLSQYVSSTAVDADDLTTIVPSTIESLNTKLNATQIINITSVTTATTMPHSCAHGVLKTPPVEEVSLYTVHGRYLITIITSDPYSPQLVLQRANAFNLLETEFEIGN